MAIKIVTDSTSYIPSNLTKELDIAMVSLNVNFDDESYHEVDISNSVFYNKFVLQIRPILTVEDGKVAVLSKVRTQKKLLKKVSNKK
ncbi:DegV family protein [Peptococcaceae bacterium]|nr:DegV family protein [Peptococcaceae bacterium]